MRKKSAKAHTEAYFNDLEYVDELPGFYTAFTAGVELSNQQINCNQLSSPPRSWKELETHPE